jgi:hypothetical protein
MVLNGIERELEKRGSRQGAAFSKVIRHVVKPDGDVIGLDSENCDWKLKYGTGMSGR